jgi:hypothetical protein
MKILFTLFEIQDFGGIAADLVFKKKGLEEAGHEVDIVYLRHSDKPNYVRRVVGAGRQGNYDIGGGITVNTLSGFYGVPVMSYASKRLMRKWWAFADRYDMVIHEIPGPNPAKTGAIDVKGYWRQVYDVETPQIISAHDAHFRDMYPHLIEVADKVRGISCTNPAGYVALEWFPGPRAFIGAPHPVLNWKKLPAWEDRDPNAVCAHVWKAWKHMDQAVRSARYLEDANLIMAGDGIERRYMTSVDKCKPKYKGVWARAERAGMDYKGMLTPSQLSKVYRNARVMVDCSWSAKFAKLNNHFNRSIIEGYNHGCVPICVDINMAEPGMQVQMFQKGKTHFEIAHDATPRQLAELIDHVVNLPPEKAAAMVKRGRRILLDYFDYRKTSLEYIKLAKGKAAGVYPKLEVGKTNKTIKRNVERFMTKVDRQIAKRDRKAAEQEE